MPRVGATGVPRATCRKDSGRTCLAGHDPRCRWSARDYAYFRTRQNKERLMQGYDYLVVGGGMAAAEALVGLREADPKGSIGLLAAEPHRPYDRPPLSKGLWKEGAREESIWRSIPEDVDLRLGRRAMRLDLEHKRVSDAQGEEYGFTKILLATGGR